MLAITSIKKQSATKNSLAMHKETAYAPAAIRRARQTKAIIPNIHMDIPAILNDLYREQPAVMQTDSPTPK